MEGPQNINNISIEYDFSGYKLADEINIVILTVIYLFGVVGNMFVIYIYSRKTTFIPFNIYRISLAMCDIFACIANASQMPLVYWYKIQEMNGSATYIKTFNLMLWFVAMMISFHLVMIAIDRLKAAYRQSIHRPKKMNVMCKIVWIYIASIIMASLFATMQFILPRPLAKKMLITVSLIVSFTVISIFFGCYTAIFVKLLASKVRIHPIENRNKRKCNADNKIEKVGSNHSNPAMLNTR